MKFQNLAAGLSILVIGSAGLALAAENELRIENAWIREAPPVARVSAGYLDICNDSDKDIALLRVRSAHFSSVEIHTTVERDGASRMLRLESVTIPAGECANFAPGGKHLMLFNPKSPLQVGDAVPLHFSFDNGTNLNIRVDVKRDASR